MLKNCKKWLKAAVFAALMGIAPEMYAQAVLFPQQEKPTVAALVKEGNTYKISNNLFTASFKEEGGKLTFEGCPEMDLQRNDNIFHVVLGERGTKTVWSSEMTLQKVEMEELAADPKAATGSFRFPGKAIKATYVYEDGENAGLTIVWRAILREGSHYLRTKMDITANKDTRMFAMVPFRYDVSNVGHKQVPSVVGNTRGAVVMNDQIFAGLESPMGINTVESEGVDAAMLNFQPKSWNSSSFNWNPGAALPQGIKDLNYTADQVRGAHGYVKFYKAGDVTITFDYDGGPNKLITLGVDVLDGFGNVVASKYHKGETGNADSNNAYTFNLKKADSYQVRYFVANLPGEPITSHGTIIYDQKIAPAQVEFVMKDAPAKSRKMSRALSGKTIGENDVLTDSWTQDTWKDFPANEKFPLRIGEMGYSKDQVSYLDQPLEIQSTGKFNVKFNYLDGSQRLDMIGFTLLNEQGQEAVYDYHKGHAGKEHKGNVYSVQVPNTGKFTLRYYVAKGSNSSGNIALELVVPQYIKVQAPDVSTLQCKWSRDVMLPKDTTWQVSAVVGLLAKNQKGEFAKDQARRSIASYVERERAVPWRPYPIYNSWYELNINRNNDKNYTKNMNHLQCEDIVRQWQKNLYEPYGEGIQAFVWDDGWDIYGEWQFNSNFPDGFKEQDRLARQMDAGTGAWLGPVGGYGESGNYRRSYWDSNNRGGMHLSNPNYYKVFYKGCTDLMVNKGYDFRYFKFDGISAQFTSVGPDGGTVGEENAEGIIYAELDMRKVNPFIFFNTSVGTWASPFWFRITDAVWRQENDCDYVGTNSSDRERWITYRDRLVYQNFVQNSPMCPINNLMTHGFILSEYGPVPKDRNYDAVVRELRCAFACGSAMVELYCDYKLMNEIADNTGKKGALWGELARCIEWQKKNAAVLPDVHWVGGNPWDGSTHHVYGWGAWNEQNAVLALRNGDNKEKQISFTLREALEIPDYVSGTITLNKAFDDQKNLTGLATGQPIGIDESLTLTLPGSSVYVFDNTQPIVKANYVVKNVSEINNRTAYTIKSAERGYLTFNNSNGFDANYLSASFGKGEIADATPDDNVTAHQFAFVRSENTPEGQYYMYSLGAKKFVSPDGIKMRLTTEPVAAVTVNPVTAGEDNNQFVIKFGDKSVNLTNWEAFQGTKITTTGNDVGNMMTIKAVNHKAGLSREVEKVNDLFKYTKLNRNGWVVTANSNHPEGNKQCAPGKVVDGDLNTYWHNNYGGGEGKNTMPYEMVFDLTAPQKFCSFGYYARLDSDNGTLKSYALDISSDKTNWKTVKSGSLDMTGRKFVWAELGKTVEAQYVRLTIASNQAGDNLACMSEFYLGHDGSEVSPEIQNLPLFSTEEAPKWYHVAFKNGGGYIEDMGEGQNMMTGDKMSLKNQQWQFVGNENSYFMKNAVGRYVTFGGKYFTTTSDKMKASELQFVQGQQTYLEIKVKGASNNMNQESGQGIGKQLATWTPGDNGNVLSTIDFDASVITADLPVFNNAWYLLKFKNGGRVIENKGIGNSARLAEVNVSANQAWKFVGNRMNFQIVNVAGQYLEISNKEETDCGYNAGKNGNPLRVAVDAYGAGYKMVVSTNGDHAPAWEIASRDGKFNGKCFNMHAGNESGRTIGQWNLGNGNNPLEFVKVGKMDIKTVEGYGTVYSDKSYKMPTGVEGTTVTGVTVGSDEIGILEMPWNYQANSEVPANTALIIKGEKGSYFYGYTNSNAVAPSDNYLKGQMVNGPIASEPNTYYYLLTYSMEGEPAKKTLGFFWGAPEGEAFTTSAGKAYLAVPQTTAAQVRGFRLIDEVTGVEDTMVVKEHNTVIYNLAGVRMNVELNQLPKGIYIVNGKKIIIK